MKILPSKRFWKKVIGLQLAILFTLVLTEMTMAFFATHRLLVVERKEGSWKSIAQTVQAEGWLCQQELDQFKKLRDGNNQDVLK